MSLTRRSIGIAGPAATLAFLLATTALYGWCWPTVTPDMTEFLLPWLAHLARQGPTHAFAAPFGNYAPPYAAPALFPLGYAAALGTALAYIIRLSRRPLDPRALVLAALLSAFAMPALLPKMHERYYLLADLLAYVYACAARDRAGVLIATGVQLCSLLSLFAFTVHLDAPVASGGPFSLILLGLMVQTLIVRPPPGPDERIGIARAQAAAPGPS